LAVLLALLCTLPLRAEVHRSSNLGWTADQDVTKVFGKLLKDGTLKPGDELVLDHTYKIRGSHKLPDKVTLSAVKDAGFDVADADNNKMTRPLLVLGNNNTLRNLTITYLNTPPLGPTGEKHEVNFTRRLGIQARDKSDIRIENCRLTGSIGHHLKLMDCSKVKVIGTHVAGGHWSVFLIGVTDVVFERCLIEKCQGDGIKTGGGSSGNAVRNILVENCVFQNNLRDGIDTTGGFNDGTVRNSIFRRLEVSGIDLKSFYQTRSGRIEDLEPQNIGILIEDCLFHDMPNAVILTTLDGGRRKGPEQALLNAENMKEYAAHDVQINDCVVGHAERPMRPSKEGGYGVNYPSRQGEYMRAIYVKDAYDVRYRDLRLSGERIRPVYVRSIGASRHLSREAAQAIDHSVTGNVVDEPAPEIEPGMTDIPFKCGPQPLGK
jgi:hypothetical protein